MSYSETLGQRVCAINYAGARWVKSVAGVELTPFTAKVANVLGQVYAGIYHIDDAVLRKKMISTKQWERQAFMGITVTGQLATFDGDALTRLILCSRKAGVSVEIHGSYPGYTKLLFSNESSLAESVMGVDSLEVLGETHEYPSQLRGMISRCTHVKRLIEVSGDCLTEFYSTEPIGWLNLQELVAEAHKHSIRVSLQGNSPNSLKVALSRRLRSNEGSIFERHPTLSVHTKALQRVTDIDYEAE